jgi:predicted MPP superfamily phosphohydrolase
VDPRKIDITERRRAVEASGDGHVFIPWRRNYPRGMARPSGILLELGLRALGLWDRACIEARSPVVECIDLCFPDMPPAFDGFRVLHLSDLHLDGVPGLADATASLLSRLQADLCVVTGDYPFHSCRPTPAVWDGLHRIVTSIRPDHGWYSVLGNHDACAMVPLIESAGIRVLVNAGVAVRRGGDALWLAGVDDPFYYRCADVALALSGMPDGAFPVLLAHTPEVHRKAAAAGVRLYLCGHTHGGQIRIPGIGPLHTNVRCPSRLSRGGDWTHGAMRGRTSRGLGASLSPVRLGCPPEVTMIRLLRSAPA